MTLAGLIHQRYPPPEWATFFEVGNATGFRTRRHADAVALGVWPSRGHVIIGFEFKDDRRDWLREKKDPAKAEEVAQHCDRWYLVIGDAKVATVDELPQPWGLLVANESRTKLTCVKEAVPFQDRDHVTVKRTFAAAMLRKIGETMVPKVELERLIDERAKNLTATYADGRELKYLQTRYEELQKNVRAFEEAAGVTINDWRGPTMIGAAVKAVLSLGNDRDAILRARQQLLFAANAMDEALKAWPA